MERSLESFWKNICESKLMPLTTAYGHPLDNRKLYERLIYNQEANYVDLDRQKGVELENLCLRLTQNF